MIDKLKWLGVLLLKLFSLVISWFSLSGVVAFFFSPGRFCRCCYMAAEGYATPLPFFLVALLNAIFGIVLLWRKHGKIDGFSKVLHVSYLIVFAVVLIKNRDYLPVLFQ